MILLLACSLREAPEPGATEEIDFVVPKGATARGLADTLTAERLVPAAWKWEWFLRTGADGSCLKAGKHRVKRSMTAPELLAVLCGPPIPDDQPFTVVEGWRIRDIDAALAAKGWIAAGAYTQAAATPSAYTVTFPLPASLEGYLYPETYMVTPDRLDPARFIQRQLDTFAERFVAQHPEGFAPRTLHEVVVMASMIEREEPTPANRPLIAGILWKRIDAGWNLGVDATSRYTLEDWNDRGAFMLKLRDPTDPWNTRLKRGLPPTAIGNPGIVALEAAAAPVASDYWYYLHDANRTLHPAGDVRGHEANRKRYNVY